MDKNTVNSKNIMDQEKLHQLETLCTAEEPPACTASCPIHIDVKKICKLIGEGKYKEAFKQYEKSAVFPLILAYTCDAPCESRCIRKDYGGSIKISLLEKALAVSVNAPGKLPVFLPSKEQKVAIIGGNLRGMSAAFELAKKGYKTTIFEKEEFLGGWLRTPEADKLPEEALDKEIENLKKLKVTIVTNKRIDIENEDTLKTMFGDYDGVYIACDSSYSEAVTGNYQQVKCYDNVLAGSGINKLEQGTGSVFEIYDGKTAAITLDRIFQKVNIEVGREKEGSYETTLFTNLDGVTTKKTKITLSDRIPNEEEAVEEALRCIGCKCEMCVDKCSFLQEYKKNPRQYVREVYNNLSIAMGAHHANGMINSCALCSQCEAICPNGLDMSQVFEAARTKMVETRKMPQSDFEFGLLDLEYSMSDKCFLARHQKGMKGSEVLFFPGCQLAASEPDLVETIYSDLTKRFNGAGLLLSCCGITAKWAGEESGFDRVKEKIIKAWKDLGSPPVITACPSCKKMLEEEMNIPAKHITDIEEIQLNITEKPNNEFYLHHACGARYDEKIKNSIIDLCNSNGISLIENKDTKTASPCCGYGGLVPISNARIADNLTKTGMEQIRTPDTDIPILTYCVNCRDRFIKEGAAAYHILELLYPQTNHLYHRYPNWSERQDNRYKLKNKLLKEIWQEQVEEEERMELIINETLVKKLEETHILFTDIEEVIRHSVDSGDYLINPETKVKTVCKRSGNVTFWVEFIESDKGYEVKNAYSHRMDFILDSDIIKGGGK